MKARQLGFLTLALICWGGGVDAQSFGSDTSGRGLSFWEVTDSAKAVRPDTTREKAQKLKLVKRSFNYREQIGLALGMMAFILVMMTTAQEWNPR